MTSGENVQLATFRSLKKPNLVLVSSSQRKEFIGNDFFSINNTEKEIYAQKTFRFMRVFKRFFYSKNRLKISYKIKKNRWPNFSVTFDGQNISTTHDWLSVIIFFVYFKTNCYLTILKKNTRKLGKQAQPYITSCT